MSLATTPTPIMDFTANLFTRCPRLHLKDEKTVKGEIEQARSTISDNRPWHAANQYGRNQKGTYYYLSEPTEIQLYKTARYTSWGWRIVFDTSADVWNNNFKLKFKELEADIAAEKNQQLTTHLNKVCFYREAMKSTAFDREQGEALFYQHREGDEYDKLLTAPDYSKKIVRNEAINKLDYNIPIIGEFGIPNYYNISFWREGMGQPTYQVHTRRAVRFRTQNLEYDQYTGNGALKPIFADIQILLMLTRAVGDAAFRWASGLPAIFTKGITTKEQAETVKNIIGDPTSQTWLMFPTSYVEKVEMLGTSGTMLDLKTLADIPLNNIVTATTIPRPILLGEVAGVQTGSEVNERSYFALLDQIQRSLDPFIREYFLSDPEVMEILGDLEFEIDWGLREVMTVQAKAVLRQQQIANGVALAALGNVNECRLEAELIPFEKSIEPKLCKELYGYTPEEIGQMPMATFQALAIAAVVQTDEEEDDVDKPDGSVDKDDMKSSKNDPDNPTDNEAKQPEKPVKDMQDPMCVKQIMCDSILNYRDLSSLNKMSDLFGVTKTTVTKILDTIKAQA